MNDPSSPRANVLIVDDTPENLQLLSRMLADHGYEARPVPSGRLALLAVERDPPDLILLDINMPEMNGYEVCQRLKGAAATRDIPIVFISALNETLDKVKAFSLGAVDYITKPFQIDEVMARVATHVSLAHARRALERSYAELRDLETLRDGLVHMVVHDLRSPLMALICNIEFLTEDLQGQVEPRHVANLESALAAAEHLNRMANDMLDVSRLDQNKMPVKRVACDLSDIVRAAVANLKGIAYKREVRIQAEKLMLACDEGLICRVVENLVGNGLKHTPPDRSLSVSVTATAGGARIEVRDEGRGIPAAFKDRIFEKFATAEAQEARRYHSAGLGLSFCKLTIEAHGGQIGVDSEEGRGSTFWFTLPGDAAA